MTILGADLEACAGGPCLVMSQADRNPQAQSEIPASSTVDRKQEHCDYAGKHNACRGVGDIFIIRATEALGRALGSGCICPACRDQPL